MITEYIFIVFLIILGLAIMRFGIFQIRKFKEGKTKIRKKLSEQIGFLFFFIILVGLIIYSVNDLLFGW